MTFSAGKSCSSIVKSHRWTQKNTSLNVTLVFATPWLWKCVKWFHTCGESVCSEGRLPVTLDSRAPRFPSMCLCCVVGGDWICLRSAQQEEAVLFYRSLNGSHIRDSTQRKNNKKDGDRNKNWDLLYKHWMCPGGVPGLLLSFDFFDRQFVNSSRGGILSDMLS